jgi:hypothetical protein
MNGQKNKFRTISPKGAEKTHESREVADAHAAHVAAYAGADVLVQEWSTEHPQDDLNNGWALVGVVHPPGHVEPDRGTRVHLGLVQPRETITVFAHKPRFNPLSSKGQDYTGTVRSIFPCKIGTFATFLIVFTDSTQVEAVETAAAYYPPAPVEPSDSEPQAVGQ